MKFGRYEVMRREDGSMFRLGQGSTSSSYKALDLDLQVPVVLKVIRPEFLEDETARKRFLREARGAALLRHPNVAMIYQLVEEGSTCFYAREFVEGETLEAKVKRDGPLELAQALDVALQVAEALVAVKKANLVNRDIKPSNLMMDAEGLVKIIDFGLTKSSSSDQSSGLEMITLAGFVGTPDYASPEQLNEESVDVASDVYSLGVTLWFLMSGRPPFRGAMAQVMAKHLQAPPPFEELSDLPREVVALLAHMLEKDPARRPATPTHLTREIEACLAVVKGEVAPVGTAPAARGLTPAVAAAAPFSKMSASREPVADGKHQRFFLVEILVGAAIALIIYLVLSRPVESVPPPSAPVPLTTAASPSPAATTPETPVNP